MRIFQVIVGLNVGGAELMLKRLVESHHPDSIYKHTIVSLTDNGKVGQHLEALGVEVHSLHMRSMLDIPRVLWRLVGLIRASRPDIVQTWMYHADLLGGLAARLAGNRNVIWGIRTTEIKGGNSKATALVRSLCARLSRWVPHTIVCAAQASCRAHIAARYDSSRMVVVPNGFDMGKLMASGEQRAALRAECGFGANVIVVGTLGRFNPDKDHENFVHAAGLVARQYPDVRFLMVGRGLDPGNKELTGWISETGQADSFVLLGERADVPACLASMDIFCLSSRTEGFPNVVGEAMAIGLPCVVTDVGDAAMLVADTGVVAPKEDSAALAQGLTRLLTMTPDDRRKLGQRAKARIRAEFTIERTRERFEKIYRNVTNRG